jgi:deoxyribonuclease-4
LQNSIHGIKYDLAFSSAIHGGGVVVHLGSHLGKGFDSVKVELAERLVEILQSTPDDSVFLIENSAGQNGKIASDFAEIRYLLDAVSGRGISPQRIGWCFDTCHAHAAGYDLDTVDAEIGKHNLWDSLKVIHLNDSRDPFDSGRDRHDNIGLGVIGSEKMRRFIQNPKFVQYPLILEVPGFDGKGPDKKNIDIVKDMLK